MNYFNNGMSKDYLQKKINSLNEKMVFQIKLFQNLIFNSTKNNLDNESQIIICGFPRSGTSLLFNIISGIIKNHIPYTGNTNPNRISKESTYKSKILEKGSFITKQPSDIFRIKKLNQWNLRNKKIHVFVCVRDIRDLLVSKHQLLPEKYYMGYDWRLNVRTGEKINVGIKHFYHEILQINELCITNCKIHYVYYEKIIKNPNLISDILKKEGFELKRDAIRYNEEKALPYTKNDKISRGIESSGIKNNINKWINNKEDTEYIENSLQENPELKEMLSYFKY